MNKLQKFLERTEIEAEVVSPSGDHSTAKQAARTLGVSTDAIVKSLVFKAGEEFVLAVVPGSKRADTEKLSTVLEEEVEIASPNEVKRETGFRVGTVPPLATGLRKVVDSGVLENQIVYGGAGDEENMLKIDPRFIVDESSAVAEICEE